jgi:hypothetical protein
MLLSDTHPRVLKNDYARQRRASVLIHAEVPGAQ